MRAITHFWSIGSQPGRAVETLLTIGRIPHLSQRINVSKMEHKGAGYTSIYPLGLIPSIQDGDFVLGESTAILTYLCEKYPSVAHWHGNNMQERAIVNQYMSWYQNYFRIALFKPFRRFLAASNSGKPLDEPEIIELWKEMWVAIAKLDQLMTINKTEYIAGNAPTIADLLCFYELTNLTYFGASHSKYQWIAPWYKKMLSIP